MELLQWKIIQVISETTDTKTYVLEEIEGKAVPYEAGQFLTFLFYHDLHEIRRSYSISTAPGIDKHIAITVKKKVNGEISRYILRNWQPGTMISSLPPAGRFTIHTDHTQHRHIFFIAAGSGIVPVFGLIKKVLYEEPMSHITLLYQNHDEKNIIYHHPLQQLATQYPQRLNRIDLLSNPITPDTKPVRLNNWLFELLVNTNLGIRPSTSLRTTDHPSTLRLRSVQAPLRTLFYTCGPEAFMRMVQFTIRVMGFSEDQLRKEHFVIEPVRKPAFTMESTKHTVLIHYAKQTYQFTTAYPDTILQAAQHHGISLPFSCNTGRCATCVARCRKGAVKMSNNEVLTDKDLQEGMVLTCVGYAETDLELEM